MRIDYENRDALMLGLATRVAQELREAIAHQGHATLAVPGGTTPAPFLEALSKEELDWDKVFVMLGDERFVPLNSPRSNTKLLHAHLLINQAAKANLIAMTADADDPEEVIGELMESVAPHLPLDVLVVGMGEDMHTASLFPDAPDLADALDPEAPVLAIIRAENAGEPRITLTAPVLKEARHKHVLLAGSNKLKPLETALSLTSEKEAPIRVVIACDNPATIHYAD